METKQVELQSITVKEEVQQREDLNMECVEEYAEEIAKGTQFPPLVVFSDGESIFLADGRHRYEAYKLAGVESVTVIVIEGGLRDAILHAVGANTDHGLRRTNADKRKAVITLLQDEEWKCWSDGVIAEKCRVSQAFVSRLRNELTQNGFESASVRIGKDGRAIDVSNIGTRAEGGNDDAVAPPEAENATEPGSESVEVEEKDDVSRSDQNEASDDKAEVSTELSEAQDEAKSNEGVEPQGDAEPDMANQSPDDTGTEESLKYDSADDSSPCKASGIDRSCVETGDGMDADGTISREGGTEEENIDPRDIKIRDLEAAIREKDERIKELEEENEYLKRQILSYEENPMSRRMTTEETFGMMDLAV